MSRPVLPRRAVAVLRIALFVAIACLFTWSALARPGGGQSFSHGSSSSSSSGHSSGGSDVLGWLLGLIFDIIWELLPWQVKVVLLGIFLFAALIGQIRSRTHADWSTAPTTAGSPPPAVTQTTPVREAPGIARRALGRLRDVDPAFSLVLFEDFVYALYAETRYAQGRGEIDTLAPYFAGDVIVAMKAAPLAEVRAVLVGGMRFAHVERSATHVSVEVELEVNLSVVDGGRDATLFRVETWSLSRKADARSRPKERARVLDCPSCGAPLSAVIAGTCSHCHQPVATAELDWRVTRVQTEREERLPPALTNEVTEDGTELPTVVDPDAASAIEALAKRDPSFAQSSFEERARLIFREFQVAWSAQELARMRPFLSDNLFDAQQYWVDAYKKQNLRNVTENARIEKLELARVESDAAFDAITLCVRATSLDYTVADDGRVVTGSKTRERRYAEYWTFLRGAGRTGATRTEAVCPSCGAPLDINMAGVCAFCQAKVTTGEFDWVLSRIEQDDAYVG